jgi:hypothetical protein
MTTTVRDSAKRCSRCQRVTLGTAPLWLHEGREIVDVIVLCTRCRTELKPQLVGLLRGAA